MAHLPKGRAAKLKAYLATATAGERWRSVWGGSLRRGASRSVRMRHGCLAAEASEGALVAKIELPCLHYRVHHNPNTTHFLSSHTAYCGPCVF